MKALEEHNKEAMRIHHALNDNSPRRNGISCPECGLELWDSCPMVTLTSNPPQKNVHCDCGYRGYRVQ